MFRIRSDLRPPQLQEGRTRGPRARPRTERTTFRRKTGEPVLPKIQVYIVKTVCLSRSHQCVSVRDPAASTFKSDEDVFVK